jgi:Caspase domain
MSRSPAERRLLRRRTVASFRDLGPASAIALPRATGRRVVVTIGIDRYRYWRALDNAVSDATGAHALFQRLGFEAIRPPVLDEVATGTALRTLVTDDLRTLTAQDSLILFYAGHGGASKHEHGGRQTKTGYLIPVDAESDKVSTWIDLESWLRSVSLLPPRHILVILDACNSGIALDPVVKWRDDVSVRLGELATLQARYSRRVITSALDDERARDSGPVPGHSLFTGCLIQGLSGELGGAVVTGSQLAVWLQQRVRSYPDTIQTPDFGTFGLDDRGEMAIPLLTADEVVVHDGAKPKREPSRGRAPSAGIRLSRSRIVWRWLRREGEWTMTITALTLVGLIGFLAQGC